MCEFWIVAGLMCVLQGGYAASCEPMPFAPHAMKRAGASQCVLWEQKLEDALANKGFVFAVCFPRGRGFYSAHYDVRDTFVALHYLAEKSHACLDMIQPVEDFLTFEFLKGVRFERGVTPPAITKVGFSRRDIGHHTCTRNAFFSELLKDFLLSFNFPEEGRVSFDAGCRPLTKGVFKRMQPGGKSLLWSTETQSGFMRSATSCDRMRDEIFLVVPGEGFLRGQWVRCIAQKEEKNVFDHKLELTFDALRAAYPFDSEKEKLCINFNKKRTNDAKKR